MIDLSPLQREILATGAKTALDIPFTTEAEFEEAVRGLKEVGLLEQDVT